ncbi:class I SAM-dependent methyltransferase [Halolamina sediminis]|jgi:SAM-dependent methyltransferase|uniref:class I SAM-dependent methyltransferase n=1 Tax=Halolamina sediminis TaxID=1480675 RepID=UPI0006B5F2A2|nr:class I SAM-dependent methyltransferase [Halolamina sediminis]
MVGNDTTEPEAEQQARHWWDAWAETFQEAGGHSIAVAFGPGAPEGDDLGLLGDVSGVDAVELGCGGAQFGIALAQQGANVTGVDISAEQLDYAHDLAAEHGVDVDFLHCSVTDLSGVADDSFDLAFSAFAFMWVENLQACFAEAHRVLRDGGGLVFSVDHPFYKMLDPESGDLVRSYFSGEPKRAYSESLDAEMVVHRRPVSEIVNGLIEAGFTIERLEEPGYDDPDAYEADFGSFDPELMADVPPTLVVAAEA